VSDLKVGDKIRILEDMYNCAALFSGEVRVVDYADDNYFTVDRWYCEYDDEGTGWEKVEGDDE
jgi:hypothetical protein